MKPEAYLKEYLRPFTESAPPESVAAPEALPFLPAEHYYCHAETSHYKYNFTLDRLTREELLKVLAATGAGNPEDIKPGQLLGWIAEKDRVSAERAALLFEREQDLAELRRILQAPSYRVYRMLLVPFRAARSLWSRARPLTSRLRRKH